jgi:hypothetical protein
VQAVVGVAGGFLVAGTAGYQFIAAHYDWRRRTCTAHELDVAPGLPLRWSYVRRLHSVVGGDGREPIFAIDLGQAGPRDRRRHEPRPSLRTSRVLELISQGTPEAVILRGGAAPSWRCRIIAFREKSGEVVIRDDEGEWLSHVPLSEGQPQLAGGHLVQGRWNEGTLALLVASRDGRRTLHVFAVGRTWRSLAEYPCPRDARDFALSRDGRRIAWRLGERQIVSRAVGGVGPPSLLTPKGRAHRELKLQLGQHFLTIQAGRHAHLVRWDRGRLEYARTGGDIDDLVERAFGALPPRVTARGVPTRHGALADRRRFYALAATPGLTAAVDRFGEVAILDRTGGLVCTFLVFRDQIAVAMPDDTRVGPVPMLGGPPTPGGEERIGAALLAAADPSRRPAR